MTKQISVVNTAADTFQVWIDKTNELITASNTEYVTANTNANGSVSIGNVYLQGILFSTTLTTSGIRGGNVQSSANLSILSNVTINASSNFTLGNSTVNVYANSSSLFISGKELLPIHSQINVQTSGTSAQLVDSYVKADYRAAEYIVSIMDNAANGFQISKALTMHDSGADAYITEFAITWSNTQLGLFSSNANTTHVRLYITPTVSNTQVKATRTIVAL